MISRRVWLVVVALFACSLASAESFAQDYPSKPIRIISAMPLMNSGEMAGRLLADKMAALLGQPVVFENRQGANGAIALEYAKTLPPDGYSLLYASGSTMVTGRFTNKALDVDPLVDLTPVSLAFAVPSFLAVHSSVPVNSIEELIDYAKENPGKLAYGSPGPGSSFHLIGEALKISNQIDLLHVPYSTGVSALVGDFVSGRIQVLFPSYALIQSHLESGSVKMIGIFDTQRDKNLTAIPTVGEVLPDTKTVPSWFAFYAPAGVPPEVAQRVQEAIAIAMKDPEVVARLDELGITPVASTPDQLAETMTKQIADMTQLADALGLKATD
jgi:tripartite-type tricarboxylate transporter receptor subunit TctC